MCIQGRGQRIDQGGGDHGAIGGLHRGGGLRGGAHAEADRDRQVGHRAYAGMAAASSSAEAVRVPVTPVMLT